MVTRKTVKKYFPTFEIPMPSKEEVWFGYRPCSADGLPYLGRTKKWSNVIMATGHAMVGMSLGAGTGKLVTEIIQEQKTSIDIDIYNPERFELLEFENRYENTDEKSIIARFVPSYRFSIIDKDHLQEMLLHKVSSTNQ
jgi:hypothetical protein